MYTPLLLRLQILVAVTQLGLLEATTLIFHHSYSTLTETDFFADSYLDDIALFWYDSKSEWLDIVAPWKREMADVYMWEYANEDLKIDQEQIRIIAKERPGTVTLQYMHGCSTLSNGSSLGYMKVAFNGTEILSFDSETGNHSSEVGDFKEIVERLNRELDGSRLRELKDRCVEKLVQHLEYANRTLRRTVKPRVRLAETVVRGDVVALQCRAYGHYPKDISMTWHRNGQQVAGEEHTLPLPGHIYVSSVLVNVTPEVGNLYTCQVAHSSLKVPAALRWEGSRLSQDDDRHLGGGISSGVVIALSLVIVLLVSVSFFGFVMWESRRRAGEFGEVFHNESVS